MPGDSFRVYLHGAPGSSSELDLFGDYRPAFDYAPNRFDSDQPVDFDMFARDIEKCSGGLPIRLTGFSMGGYVAFEIAYRLGARVSGIDLIAAAAPLSGGAFLDFMAGKALFSAARDNPKLFEFIVSLQALMMRYAPSLVTAAMFSDCRGDDIALARNPGFKRAVKAMLQSAITGKALAYRAEIKNYVADWATIIPTITAPVTIWHGTLDNWAPFAMAEYLRDALPNVAAFNALEGASHYSALRVALSKI